MAVPMAEALSMAQPTTDTVPETAAFGAGESILTLGGPLGAPLERSEDYTSLSRSMAVAMAEALSMAQPTTDTVPETAAFGAGVSILALGGPLGAPLETVTVTLAEPTPGLGTSLSTA